MAKKSSKKAETKKVSLAPKATTNKRKRLTGFKKKNSPLFSQIRRLIGYDKKPKPGPKTGLGRLCKDDKNAAKQQQKEVIRLRNSLKETLETRQTEEKEAAAKWKKEKKLLSEEEIEIQINDAQKELLETFSDNLDIWLDMFGPPSQPRKDRAESDIKFMFKYPDNPESVWRP